MAKNIDFCIFEYQYRDGGNFKSFGTLLLSGKATENAKERIQAKLTDYICFYVEDLGIPPLFKGVWKWGFSTLDVPWHEFCDLRPATAQEIAELQCFGDLDKLISDFERIKPKSDSEILSRYRYLLE